MAIGVRISSNNLSGKTATVTFVPVTGTTSGSTVNLGTKTIPFNNIDSHPYGVYSLYFAEYDYTYTITVTGDQNVGQTFILMSTITGNTSNWASATLDFSDFTAEVIDFGISTNDWSIYNIYPLTEKGYMYVFSGRGNFTWGDWLVLYTDSLGNVITQYSGNTNNWNYDTLEGEIGYFSFEDAGILKYSDGVSGYTFNWTSGTGNGEFNQFDIEWDWDGANRDGKFIFSLYNDVTGDKQYYLADHGTHTLLTTSNVNDHYVYFSYQWNSNFFVEIKRNTNDQLYQYVKIYNTSGTLVQTYDLTGNSYNNIALELYGDNQMFVMFYNWNDPSIDYYIRTYNGTNNQSQFLAHNRSNYQNFNINSDGGIWPEDYDLSSISVLLYQTGGSYYNLVGNSVTYCDVLWCLNNSEVINYEIFQDTGNDNEKTINTNFRLGKRPFTLGTTGDGNLYSIMLTPTGISYNSIGISSNFHLDYVDTYYCEPNKVLVLRDVNDPLIMTLHLISSGNTVSDTQQVTVTDYPWNYSARSSYGLFWLSTPTDTYYTNSLSSSISVLNGENYPWNYSSYNFEDNIQTNSMLGFNPDTGFARVFGKTTTYPTFQIPLNNGNWNLRFGKDRIFYVYGHPDTGNVNIHLYNFNGTLLNSQELVGVNGWNDTWGVKNRFVVTTNENNNIVCYLVSDNVITSTPVSNYNNYTMINDFVWWND